MLSFVRRIRELVIISWKQYFRVPQGAGQPLKSRICQLADCLHIGGDRTKAIVNLPTPTNTQEFRLVLGMVNFVKGKESRDCNQTSNSANVERSCQTKK